MNRDRDWLTAVRTVVCGVGLAALALSSGGAAVAYGPNNEEDRCTELGQACECSDSLNADDGSFELGGNNNYYPSNTRSSPKACGNFTYARNNANTNPDKYPNAFEFVPETDMPSGNEVQHVLAVYINMGNPLFDLPRTPPAGAKRICMRHYFRYSDDFPQIIAPANNPSKCERVKIGEYGGSDVGWSHQLANWSHKFSVNAGGKMTPQGDTNFKWSDCKDQWCRAELCASADFGSGNGPITTYSRVTGVNTGQQVTHTVTGQSGNINNFRREVGLWLAQGTCRPGERYYSHIMSASWPSDNGQWIGAAYEIEDGSAPAPSPPPPASPPEPPILLEPIP